MNLLCFIPFFISLALKCVWYVHWEKSRWSSWKARSLQWQELEGSHWCWWQWRTRPISKFFCLGCCLQILTGAAFLLACQFHLTGTPQPGSSDPGISGLSRQSHGAFEWRFWRGYWTDKVWKCWRPYQECYTRRIKLCCQGKGMEGQSRRPSPQESLMFLWVVW